MVKSSKTLLARAQFVARSAGDRPLSLEQALASVLSLDIEPARRHRLERLKSLIAKDDVHVGEPNAIVRRACDLVREDAHHKKVPFVVYCTSRPIRVRDAFSEALSCLLHNAIRANRRGQPVHVDVRDNGDRDVLWQIRDTGAGIARDVLARLGDPFHVTPRRGLGVAIANAIIQDHDGTLRFESHAGIGTTASVLMPSYEQR